MPSDFMNELPTPVSIPGNPGVRGRADFRGTELVLGVRGRLESQCGRGREDRYGGYIEANG